MDHLHWFDIAVLVLSFVGAVLQFWGAGLDRQPCRNIKLSYGVTLSIIFLTTLIMKGFMNTHGVLSYALVLLLFTGVTGAGVRLWELQSAKRRSTKHECTHS